MPRKRDGEQVKIKKSIRVEPRIVSRLEKEFGTFSNGINEVLKIWENFEGEKIIQEYMISKIKKEKNDE